jgi:membrane protein YdbS with pleckstrin-like domain
METLHLKPDVKQKTLWFTIWGIVFGIGTLALLLLIVANPVVFGLILVAWLIVTVAVLSWIPPYFASLRYAIESDAIRAQGGVFWKRHVTVPFVKITHLDVTQGPLERSFGVGVIHIQTAGAGGAEGARAELRLVGMRNLDELKEAVRVRMAQTEAVVSAAPASAIATGDEPLQVLKQILAELRTIGDSLKNR